MKIKLHHILILTCIALSAIVNSSIAQDSSVPEFENTDSEREKIEDRIINSPGEGDARYIPRSQTISQHTAVRDSVIARPLPPVASTRPKTDQTAKPVEKPNQPKQNDDSILSFNFLYYIIQKYKLQDIVD